ncbi:hypothetical protein, partial [Acinetobacter baumannii]|uniref:hypothetical protein n=1 Tax=Acinetobacter baumannii TaxID=470 RepID=UPI00148935AA
ALIPIYQGAFIRYDVIERMLLRVKVNFTIPFGGTQKIPAMLHRFLFCKLYDLLSRIPVKQERKRGIAHDCKSRQEYNEQAGE